MKTIIYMAMSTNGMVSTLKDDTPWSNSEFKEFYKFAKNVGNMIIGRKTYDIMNKDGELKKLKGVRIIILTHEEIKGQITAKTPPEAIRIISDLGMHIALICGGTKTNSSFLKSKLINELILDIEPIIIGEGRNLIEEMKDNIKLKLISKKEISKDSIQLRYKVLK